MIFLGATLCFSMEKKMALQVLQGRFSLGDSVVKKFKGVGDGMVS